MFTPARAGCSWFADQEAVRLFGAQQTRPDSAMIDCRFVGWRVPVVTITVEQGQVALFCKSIGEDSPVYGGDDVARAAGLPAIPTPPTFGFTLKALAGQPFNYLTEMGVDNARLLHGSQAFEYLAPIHVGEAITVATIISAIEEKGGGRLTIVTTTTDLSDQDGMLRIRLSSKWLVQNGGADAL